MKYIILFFFALGVTTVSCARFRASVTPTGGVRGNRARRKAVPVSQQLRNLRTNFSLYWPDDVRTGCNGDNDCCTWDRPCGADEGDCEVGQCAVGLVCRENNCQVLHAGEENRGGYSATDDCCEPRKLCHGVELDEGCCSPDTPCILGEGLCSSDDDCASDLVCGECKGIDPHAEAGEKCCMFKCDNLKSLAGPEKRGIVCA